MSSCVPWDFEDTEGLNPFEKPGTFDFNVWYELDYPEPESGAYYGNVPAFEIIGVTCTRVHFEGEKTKTRRPTEDEQEQLSSWFSGYIDSRPDEYEALKDHAFEYSFVDPGDEAPDYL